MKVFKIILWALLIFILAVFLTGFFLPRTVSVSRSVMIKGSVDDIFEQVNTLKNWEKWSPWHHLDTTMTILYSGPGKGIGASYSWKSGNKNVGTGKISIINSFPYDSVILDMDFMENGKSVGKFIFSKADISHVAVTWTMTSDLGKNPVIRYFGLLMDRFVGPDFEKGLQNIRHVVESHPETTKPFKITETDIPARIMLTIRDTCSGKNIRPKMGFIYGEIFNIIKQKHLQVTGFPVAIFHTISPALFDIEAGVAVNKIVSIEKNNVQFTEMPQQHAVMAQYFGPYEGTAQAYAEIEKYITANKLSVTAPVIEEYISDPKTLPDTAKWQTNIYLPVK